MPQQFSSFAKLGQDPKLREVLFAKIASSPQLQRGMLQALSRYPGAETELVTEFAKRLNLRRWLLKIAGRRLYRNISSRARLEKAESEEVRRTRPCGGATGHDL